MRNFLIALFIAASIAAQVRPPEKDLCTLEGVVKDQITGEPVRKATVFLQGVGGSFGPAIRAYANTDASGTFRVRELPAGQYVILASHPAFQANGNSGPIPKSVQVVLRAGETKRDVSLAVVPPAGISGRVIDNNGDPIAYCAVTTHLVMTERGRRRLGFAGTSSTNENGEYHIGQLKPGKYLIVAQSLGRTPRPHGLELMENGTPEQGESYQGQYYPGSTDISGAMPITLGPGAEQRGVDFRMRASTFVKVKGHIALPGSFEGRPDLQVSMNPRASEFNLDRTLLRYGRVKPTGEFEVPFVTPGSYFLIVSARLQGKQFALRQQVDIGTEIPQPLDVTLVPGADIRGSLQFEGDPIPAEQLIVTLESGDGFTFLEGQQRPKIENGNFVLSNVIPGSWLVHVDGLQNQGYIKSMRFGDQETRSGLIEVSGASAGALQIVISRKGGRVEIGVQREGDSAQHIAVLLVPQGEHFDRQPYLWALGNAISGQAAPPPTTFEHVAPGRYRLYAIESPQLSMQFDEDLLKALEDRSELIEVEEGARVSRTLKVITSEQVAEKQ